MPATGRLDDLAAGRTVWSTAANAASIAKTEQALLATQASVRGIPNWLTGYRTVLMSPVRLGQVDGRAMR